MPTAGQLTIEPAQHAASRETPVPVRDPPDLGRWMRAALWTAAVATLAGWVALAAAHLDDDYRVSHTQGVWIAAAEAARAGWWYPPLVDSGHYSGTRYLPVAIAANALASRVAGDPLVGGKLLAAASMAALLALVVVLLRRFSCPWPLAAALAAVIPTTEAGLQAATTIGGDIVPVVLQVAALAAALGRRGTAWTLAAGALTGLAVASKLTALWGLCAIVTWLASTRQWRRAAAFAAASGATAAAVLGGVQLLTQGRLGEHVLAFSLAGLQGTYSVLRAPNQLLYHLHGHAAGAEILLPLAVLGALAAGWRRASIVHLALAYALLLLLVVYADVGTGFNQLLDVVVLTTLAAGHLAGRAASGADPRSGDIVVQAVAIAAIWAAGIGLVRTVGVDLRRDAAARSAGTPPARMALRVAEGIGPEQRILAEDPSIEVALGRRPVIMDAFMLNRLDRVRPALVNPLIQSIADRRFDVVVLVVPLEDRSLDFWWADYHLGPRVAAALRRAYRLDGTVGRYYVYRPVA